jgi:hypothetical protein
MMKSKREIVGVAFQYWLQAFGSPALEDFKKNDTLNARLLDQQFAHNCGMLRRLKLEIGGQSARPGFLYCRISDVPRIKNRAFFSTSLWHLPICPTLASTATYYRQVDTTFP